MTQNFKPPATLAGRRVLEYALIDESLEFRGQGRFFSGDAEIGRVPCLALCDSGKEPTVYLLHCDRDWSILFTEHHPSLHEAKTSAEHTYPGVSTIWIGTHTTVEDATKHLKEIWGPHRCNFCGKTPLDLENPRYIEKNGAVICETCVMSCYEILREDQEDSSTSRSQPS